MLRFHAADLIDTLRRWNQELEARETQLNTRDALLDARQRQLRVWERSQRSEIDLHQRRAAALEAEAQNRLRRIAAMEMGLAPHGDRTG
jgi:hypothetical protein